MTSTAGVVWDASKGMCDFLESRPEEVAGKRVLELGCGTALPGLVAAVLGASDVLLTDMAEALGPPRDAVARNAALLKDAGALQNVEVAALMWGEGQLQDSILGRGNVDVLIAADVLGATADGMIDGSGPFGLFFATLKLFAALPKPPRFLLAYKRRLKYRELP